MEINQVIANALYDILGIEESEITKDSHLRNDFGCDSMDRVEIIMYCERALKISIDDDLIEKIGTVQDLINICNDSVKNK